jgi:hypothetical protein
MRPIKLTKIADNLSDTQHEEICAKILELGIDGIEISEFGGRWGATWDTNKNYNLHFLKFYNGIKALRIQLYSTVDISQVAELSDSLEYLHIGHCSNRKCQINFLGQIKNLKTLSTVKQFNGLDSITSLSHLTELGLTGYPIEKMDFLNELKTLKNLYLGFGTSSHINTINKLVNLEELQILWIKKLSNIDAVSSLQGLRKLKVEDQKQIVTLPDFSKLTNLKNIRLMNLTSLQDISSIKGSYLQEFVWTGPNKNADILNSIKGTNLPERVYTYFYTQREQRKAEQILGDKFSSLDKMKFEVDDNAPLNYYDLNTGQRVH